MRRLIQKYPGGYEGRSPRADYVANQHTNAMAVGQNAEVQQQIKDVDVTPTHPSGQGPPVSAETKV